MSKIILIAKNTFLQYFRGRLSWAIGLAIFFNLIISFVISSFTFGVPERVALDIGMGLAHFVTIILAFVLGIVVLAQEIESRTVYMTLVSSTTRSQFLLGKILGIICWLSCSSSLITFSAVCFYIYLGGPFSSIFIWASLFSLIEAIIIMLWALLFSLLANRILASLFTILLYLAGQTMLDPGVVLMAENNSLFKAILNVLPFVIPDFSRFNLRDYLIYQHIPPSNFVFCNSIYGALFILLLTLFSWQIFRRKDLN